MTLFASKKAVIGLVAELIIGLFLLGIVIFLAYIFLSNFISDITATAYNSTAMTETADNFLDTLKLFDKFIVLLMVAGLIGVGYGGYKLIRPRIFFLASVFGAVFLGFMSSIFNYTFSQYATNTEFAGIIGFFPLTIIILTNLHWIALAGFVLGSLTLYAKKDDIDTMRGAV